MDADNIKLINGSGLFFFRSRMSIDRKIEILNWYNSLTEKEREYIQDLRNEASDDTEFFSNEN